MKKYKLKQTGEFVKIGSTISITVTQKTSFGKIITKEIITVDEPTLKELIHLGYIEEYADSLSTDISFYVQQLAVRMHKDVKEVADMLESLNQVCPRAVLDVLLNTIAIHFYNDNPAAFDEAEHYYSIRLYDGKCGEVHNIHGNIPLFKSKEDVEIARTILEEQLKFMYGKQKSN